MPEAPTPPVNSGRLRPIRIEQDEEVDAWTTADR
jgi:hypothetical protein